MKKVIIKYKWKSLRRVLKYSRFFTIPFSNLKVNKYSQLDYGFSPLFIIGAPRSGTTLIYQLITNYFKISYPSNLVELSHENIYFGFWLKYLFFKNRPHNCFKSFYGLTESCGLNAPNEKGKYWWKWIPKSYLTAGQVDDFVKNDANKKILSIMNRYKKPIIFKHLTLGLQIPFVLETFPNAKFIFVKRKPVFTIQSLYKEVLAVGDNIFDWVGVWPKGYEKLIEMPRIEKISKYIHLVYNNLLENIKQIPQKNLLVINYDNLLNDYDFLFKKLEKMYDKKLDRRINPFLPDIKISSKQKVGENEFTQILNEVQKLDWEMYEEFGL